MCNDTAAKRLGERGGKRCLVSVGTTDFDELIEYLDVHANELIRLLSDLQFDHLTVQKGRGSFKPTRLAAAAAAFSTNKRRSSQNAAAFTVVVVDFVAPEQWHTLTEEATLVICHAGAGSIMESLRSGCKLLVVVNQKLMHNHQLELATKLAVEKYLFWSYPSNLLKVLEQADFSLLLPLKQRQETLSLRQTFPALLQTQLDDVDETRRRGGSSRLTLVVRMLCFVVLVVLLLLLNWSTATSKLYSS